jgi:hypothetical protein
VAALKKKKAAAAAAREGDGATTAAPEGEPPAERKRKKEKEIKSPDKPAKVRGASGFFCGFGVGGDGVRGVGASTHECERVCAWNGAVEGIPALRHWSPGQEM